MKTLIAENPSDIILINEALQKYKSTLLSTSLLYIPEYSLYTNFDDNCNYNFVGGVCIYLSTSLNVQEIIISDSDLNDSFG